MIHLIVRLALLALGCGLFAGNIQYTYDAAGRLAKVDYGDGRTITYSYDAAGNLLKREQTGVAAAATVEFEANQGQIDGRYQFLARRGTFNVAVAPDEALFVLHGATVRLQWLGARSDAKATGLDPRAATTNYLTGGDSRQWRTGVPHFGGVRYAGIFPGVDIVYYGNPQQLEYDLIVQPGGDPSRIRFQLDGATGVRLAPNGDLVLQAGGQTALFQKPVLHQMVNGVKRAVAGSYEIAGGSVGFRTGAYDRTLPLVIDPVFADYTLAGGTGDEFPTAAAEDAQGFLYVLGTTNSVDLPGVGRAVQTTNSGSTDLFVMKLSHNTKALVWVTYLGGTAAETAGGLTVSRDGIVTISGTTASQNFPVSGDALQRTYGGGASDGFVAQLNSKGERLLYGSYLGGSGDDAARGVAVDAAGNIYAAGVTASANFATRPGAVQEKHNGATDGFVVKINPGEPQAVYSTFLGGAAGDAIQALAVDAAGSAYVAGATGSANFPVTAGVVGASAAGGVDGFVAKLNPAGSALAYGTFLGGSADDQVLGLALGTGGTVMVSGVTASRNLPMAGSVLNRQYQGGATDGFLLQVSANGGQILAGSYLGGNGEDSADAIAVRVEGTILVGVNGTSFAGEPSRMYAYSGDLSRELGIQTIGAACTGGGSRIVALSHNPTRSLAIGWARAGAECNAPQWLALPRDGNGKEERERMASSDRHNTGHVEMFVGASGAAPPAPPQPAPAIRPAAQYKSGGSAGDPFSTATGEHTDQFSDLRLGGLQFVQFERYYSSALDSNEVFSGLGVNWSHNFDLSVASANGTAVVTLEGGVKVTFRLTGGAWQMQAPQRSEYRLVESAADFKLGDSAGARIVTFNKKGQLTRIEDRNGNALQVTPGASGPTTVTDGLGRTLQFTYAGGFLTEVRDHTGRAVRFSYRGENLTGVTDVYGRTTRYEYAAGGRLTRHVLPAGTPAYANVYDARGRVSEQSDAEGRPTKVVYEASGVTAVTDPMNAVTRHTHDANGDLTRVTDATGATTEMTYDGAHRRTAWKDRLGNTTAVGYHAPTGMVQSMTDAAGNMTTMTYAAQTQAGFPFYNVTKVERPDGSSASYEYDLRGNPVTITDRAGKVWKYTYNAQGLPLTLTAPGGAVSRWTYNTNGTLASTTTFNGEVTAYTRDALGRITKITHPDGAERQFAYDAGDHVVQQTDENGKTLQYGIDANEQLAATTDELGATDTVGYAPSRLPAQRTDRLGNKVTVSYNRNNLVDKITDAAGAEIEFVYDALHRITGVKDALGVRYEYGYDKEGAPVSAADGAGRAWTFAVDKLGRMTKATSPLGGTVAREYDAGGRVAASTNGAGETIRYSYDGRGLLAGVEAAGGLKTALARDEFGNVVTLTDAGGAAWKSSYDAAGRVASRTDPLDRTFRYSYDKGGRMAEITMPEGLGVTTLGYDTAGRLVSTRFADGVEIVQKRDDKGRVVEANGITLTYDANDRIVSSNGIATERDALGRIAATMYAPEKAVRYSYNVRGQVTKITDWLGGETAFRYDGAGALTAIERPNGVVTALGYDGDGRLGSIEEKREETIGALRYQYDAADRVTAEERTTPAVASLETNAEEFAYDAAAQWTGAAYDAAGRLQTDGRRTFTWDGASRAIGFSTGESTVGLAYNARGELTSRAKDGVATAYVVNYATARPVIATERAGDTDVRYYVHLPNGKLLYSIDAETGARRFYHFDRMGSTTFLTGDDGAVTDAYEITPYGETVAHTGSSENPFTFLGAWGVMQQDAGGIYLMRYRLYDAKTARFLSRDPRLDPSPRAVNPYQYALADPLTYADTKGLSAAPSEESFNSLGDFFKWLFSTPAGQQMMRDAERQEAEEARKKAEEEERERERVRAETARIYREAMEAQQRFLTQFANARVREVMLWAMTGYRTLYTCDLNLACVSTASLSRAQVRKATETVARQSSLAEAAKGGQLLAGLSAKLVGLDGGTLVGLDGGTLVGLDGSTLVGNDGSTLVGNDGASLVGK